jgi:imidazolonepropionase-like amidohydrolase
VISLLAVLALVQSETVAVTNARILTVAKGVIPSGTVLVREGRISEVGAELKIPAGTRVIDAGGGVLAPGWIHALYRPAAGPPGSDAAEEIHPSWEIFAAAARHGVTSFGVGSSGTGWAALGAWVKAGGPTRADLVVERGAFHRFGMQSSTAAKEGFKSAFDAARKAAEKKPDDKDAALIRVLKGEIPLLVELAGPGELLHFWQVLDALPEASKLRVVYAGGPELWKAAEELGRRKGRVILRPIGTTVTYTRDRVNPAAELIRAGATVAFAPTGDSSEAFEGYRFRLAQTVKEGAARDAVLRGATMTAAEFLGLEKRAGSIEAGKDADLVLYDRDPLDVPSRVLWTMIHGVIRGGP